MCFDRPVLGPAKANFSAARGKEVNNVYWTNSPHFAGMVEGDLGGTVPYWPNPLG